MDVCDVHLDSRYAAHGLGIAYLLRSKVLVDACNCEGGVCVQGGERSKGRGMAED